MRGKGVLWQARTRRWGFGSVLCVFVVLAFWGALGAARAANEQSYEALRQWLDRYRETQPGFEPGQRLTLKDRHVLEPFLPQSSWAYYFFDGMEMEITEPGQYPFPPEWGEQVPADYHLDAAGVLINFKGGGFPFPSISPGDPQAAVKVIWNMLWEPGTNDHSMEMRAWSRSEHGKLDRRFEFVSTQAEYALGDESLVPGYEEVRAKMSMEFLSPRDMAGAKQLFILYLDHYKENSGWMYSPVQRKPRRVLASERTSEMMGMDFTMEDMMGFGGKVHEQEWSYLGRKQILATMNLETNPTAGGPHLWVPHQVRWELRDTHVLLVDPKKSNHPYSHKVLFVDTETYFVHWMVAFDRRDDQILRLQQHFRKYTEDYQEEPATQAPHLKMDFADNHGHRVFLHLGETDINVKKPHATFMHCYTVKKKYSPGRAKQVFSLRNMASGRR